MANETTLYNQPNIDSLKRATEHGMAFALASSTANAKIAASEVLNSIEAKYEKAVTGIPKKDLSEAVQKSLDKADSALQPADASRFATAAQGAKADTALQPEDGSRFATAAQGAKADSALQPEDGSKFATAAQGAKADSALQPADAASFATAAQGAKADTALQLEDAVNFVKLTDDQEIDGQKIFKAAPKIIDPNHMATDYAELVTKKYADTVAALGVPPPLDGSMWERVQGITFLSKTGISNHNNNTVKVWLNRFIGVYFVNIIGVVIGTNATDDTDFAQIPDTYPLLSSETYLHFGGGGSTYTANNSLMVRQRYLTLDKNATASGHIYVSAMFPAGL